MWNFGALTAYENEKYIQRMISKVQYKTSDATKLLIAFHDYLAEKFDTSFVSLRDIERFRIIYNFFQEHLPLNPHATTATYPEYNNSREERALILSFIFCYAFKTENKEIKENLYEMIEKKFELNKGHVLKVKQVE